MYLFLSRIKLLLQVDPALPPLVQAPLLIDDPFLKLAPLPLDHLLLLAVTGMFFRQVLLAALHFFTAIIQSRQLATKCKQSMSVLLKGLERRFVVSSKGRQGCLTIDQTIRFSGQIGFKIRFTREQNCFFVIGLGQLLAVTFEFGQQAFLLALQTSHRLLVKINPRFNFLNRGRQMKKLLLLLC